MTGIKIMLVVGARPQFIKSAPLIQELLAHKGLITLDIIHSGQHYDREMSRIFFRELKIPDPKLNLRVGSGSHAEQTAAIMKGLERAMKEANPNIVLVPGDTNTTLAAALTASKLGLTVGHVEAGLRSRDPTMPEEINRKLTDHCSAILFAPTNTALGNLRREGLGELAHMTGDTMVDSMRIALPFVKHGERAVLDRFGLRRRNYLLVTLHRPSNVDDLGRVREIYNALTEVGRKLRVIFPLHPRTAKAFASLGPMTHSKDPGLTLIGPRGYIENLSLLKNASCLLTDSGGMQKEAFLFHVPCITLRSTTEWPETLVGKANRLLVNPKELPETVLDVAYDDRLRKDMAGLRNPFGNGHSSPKIMDIIRKTLQ
jgi:UDP-N-acetylglucosamine 2-epimerase